MKKNGFWQKQIPTLLGIGVLVVALIVGVVVFTIGGGPGVFAPRATSESTPKKIKITNITDTGFTVSFFTEGKTPGFIKYGTSATEVNLQSGDDRDQLSGTVGSYNLHHVTVRGLQPNTTYYYLLGTTGRSTFDNNGAPFTVKTSQRKGSPSAAKTVYGNVVTSAGSPADGAVLYITIEGVGELSSLVKSSGSWAIPLSNARLADGSGYAQITETQSLNLFVQGTENAQTSTLAVTVDKAQPVETITLGAGGAAPEKTAESVVGSETQGFASAPETTIPETTPGGLALETKTGETLTSTESSRTTTASSSATGGLITSLPTPTPTTTSTRSTITPSPSPTPSTTSQLALAAPTATPFSSSSPVPIGGSTASTSATATASATATSSATKGAVVATPSTVRTTQPATTSALPQSGAVSTTIALLLGGVFFLISGGWSFWIAQELREEELS